MFCEKCGAQLPDNADYCTNCGARIEKEPKMAKQNTLDTEIQLKVKPTFNVGYKVVLPLILWSILIIIIALMICLMSVGAALSMSVVFFITLAIVFSATTAISKKQYKSYSYDFYKTKVIYKDSFFNLSEKEVKYKYIREITMHQTFIQRYFNIGNITLFTNAETGLSNGIFIINVANVQEVYKKIKDIIDI